MATITSAQTGNWHDTSTWTGGSVPDATNHTNGDTIVISHGHKVTVSTDISGIKTPDITIDGNLHFANGSKMHLDGRMTVNNTNNSNTSAGEFVEGTSSSGSLLSMVAGSEIKISEIYNNQQDTTGTPAADTNISLDSLSELSESFPPVHIVFSDTEEGKIPEFFDVAGKEYPFQVMTFANYETDEVDSYMEITFPDYDNPVVILYDGNRQIKLYSGTSENEFSAEDLNRILYE